MSYAFRPRQPRSFAPVRRPAPAPVPADVIDAVLTFHDERQDQGGGRTLLRISPARLRAPEVRDALGAHAARAAGVAILWDEREDEIVRVLEAPEPRLAA